MFKDQSVFIDLTIGLRVSEEVERDGLLEPLVKPAFLPAPLEVIKSLNIEPT